MPMLRSFLVCLCLINGGATGGTPTLHLQRHNQYTPQGNDCARDPITSSNKIRACPIEVEKDAFDFLEGKRFQETLEALKNPLLEQKGREVLKKVLQNKPSALDQMILKFNKAKGEGAVHKRVGGSFYIFISLSLAKNTLLSLLKDARRYGATLVLRGLKNGSWKETIQELIPLMKSTKTPVIIDPTLFKTYEIIHVPSMVLQGKKSFDKISGNVSLSYALDLFAREGETEILGLRGHV